jgi:hypothetical protein
MNPDELREKIAQDQGWTRCYCCGHLLEACSDCAGWLVVNSPRIAASWRWFVNASLAGGWQPAALDAANAAENYNRHLFGLR